MTAHPRPGAPAPEVRPGRPGDEDALLTHVVRAFGAAQASRAGVQLAAPGGPARWLTAWEDDRLVSASALLVRTVALAGVDLPAGQLEWVATLPGHQRRGLVAAQVAAHHRRARAEGRHVLLVSGIPYLYRRLGYGYGLDWPSVHAFPAAVPGPGTGHEGPAVRDATDADVDDLVALEGRRPLEQVRLARPPRVLHDLVAEAADGPHRLVVADGPDGPRAWALLRADLDGGTCHVLPGVAVDAEAAGAIVGHARRTAPGGLRPVAMAGTPAWEAALRGTSRRIRYGHGIGVHLVDPVAVLDALRPVLDRRLAAAGRRDTGELDLSLYERTLRLHLEDGRVVGVGEGPRIEDPFAHADAGVAPDWLPALVLGRWGATALADRTDDVTLGRHRALLEVLFPRVPSDLVLDLAAP